MRSSFPRRGRLVEIPAARQTCRRPGEVRMRIVISCGFAFLGIVTAYIFAITGTARAIPNFASQTGQPCTACHVGAFGPQLTPFGRAFKMGGYTQQGGEGVAASIPLSA